MPSFIYERKNNNYAQWDNISLSGWNGLIFKIFESKNLKTKFSTGKDGIGWEISKQDFQDQIHKDDWGAGDFEIIFDIEPSRPRTNLMQLEHMYVFTHNYGEDIAYWSALLLILKPVLFSPDKVLDKFKFKPDTDTEDALIKEFLYIRGDDNGWTYGTIGRMNGALLEPCAQDYFRKFF